MDQLNSKMMPVSRKFEQSSRTLLLSFFEEILLSDFRSKLDQSKFTQRSTQSETPIEIVLCDFDY